MLNFLQNRRHSEAVLPTHDSLIKPRLETSVSEPCLKEEDIESEKSEEDIRTYLEAGADDIPINLDKIFDQTITTPY